jgi:L-serine/L-threonine ammonia-lyase
MTLLENRVAYIHPFDDPYIWEGHASIVDEISNVGVVPDVMVLSVGGGGLLCGVVEGLRRNHWENIPILAVETRGADSLSVAFKAKKHIGIDSITSIATTLGAKKIAKRAFELLSEHHIVSHVVTDADALRACYSFLDDHRTLVEPACGASLSAIYNGCDFLKDKQNIAVIVCGGVGVTITQLEEWSRKIEPKRNILDNAT